MAITVICCCPHCGESQEAKGLFLVAVETATKEAWVIECIKCERLFFKGDQKRE